MARKNFSSANMPSDEPSLSDNRKTVIHFATRMLRSVRSQPRPRQELAFREQIELFAVLPETTPGEGKDYRPETYDLTFNVDKLPELVEVYEQTRNPYALEVLLTIFCNALAFSRPIPKPMTQLVKNWVLNGRIKRTRTSSPETRSRDSSLVAAILVLRDRAGIDPTRNSATGHSESGCDIAAEIWNGVVQERRAHGENWPNATYNAARDAWKEYQKAVGATAAMNKPHAR
ncbi:hypothetical protein [Sneathiella litorea]|uniref:Uncharacterized protein n=1 Tax=Sneathiella litorea TaxID=2606216 RepID=A0A6L8W5B9_9PROT|nr:hypothetical protein [Sneathiella litorea]MZR29654.1 hypothetical protein [Sneathiella litorea]